MAQEINLGGTIYISSKRAAEMMGYSQDYVGQLARSGAIQAQRVSGLWYVVEESIKQHKEKADEYVPQPPAVQAPADPEVSVSFDGKDYISAARAAKTTGYSQDYVGQLARSGQILSRQIGNRWYVDRVTLMRHKEEKDQLLAAVQTDSVGLARPEIKPEMPEKSSISDARDTHFNYVSDEKELIPSVPEKVEEKMEDEKEPEPASREEFYQSGISDIYESAAEPVNAIPIRVVDDAQEAYSDEEVVPRRIVLRKPRKMGKAFTFSASALAVAAALGTLAYVGNAAGYLKLPSFISHPAPSATESASQDEDGLQKVRNAAAAVLSRDLTYKRESNF